MKLKNTLTEYGAISRIFHWLSATVLIIQIPLGMYLVDMDFSEKRLTIENIHVAVGISIFYLTVLRLIYKAFNPTPKLNNSIFPGQKIIAKLNHVFLYISILMIRRPPRSTPDQSSAASDVYKRQYLYRLQHEYFLWLIFFH